MVRWLVGGCVGWVWIGLMGGGMGMNGSGFGRVDGLVGGWMGG